MNGSNDNIRVVIPLTIRRRNGRPKILPPEDMAIHEPHTQHPHILKALGRAWAWRRLIEAGDVATIHEIANAQGYTDRFVSRIMRLAYLSPIVLQKLAISCSPPSVSVKDLIGATYRPWAEGEKGVLDGGSSP